MTDYNNRLNRVSEEFLTAHQQNTELIFDDARRTRTRLRRYFFYTGTSHKSRKNIERKSSLPN